METAVVGRPRGRGLGAARPRRAFLVTLATSAALGLAVVLALALWPSSSAPRQVASLPGLRLGQAVPDFTLPDIHGGRVRLAALRGHTLLINFWSPTCPPCVTEMPLLERAALAGRRAVGTPMVLGIEGTPDSSATIAAFGRRVGATYPLLLDSILQVTYVKYHVGVLPTSIVVDPEGRLRAVHLGPMTLPQMRQALGLGA